MEEPAQEVTAAPARGVRALWAVLGDIHLEQTLFSLPFVALSALLALARTPQPLSVLAWILLAVVAARACAMAVNRFADAFVDAGNPRTARRAVPSGRVARGTMGAFAVAMLAVFVVAAAQLNPLCLALSPVALLFLVGYSWTKRFTPLCHLWLGTAIGIAPLGAWAGVTASLATATPWALFAAVATWIAGFDVFYACPDAEIDRRDGLRSIPETLGVPRAFLVSHALHALTVVALGVAGAVTPQLGAGWWTAVSLGALVLLVEHRIVRPGDYRRMPTAFFRLNALFGLLLLAGAATDLLR
jgi:4-hydroxybenzoate polyprenyltransferase